MIHPCEDTAKLRLDPLAGMHSIYHCAKCRGHGARAPLTETAVDDDLAAAALKDGLDPREPCLGEEAISHADQAHTDLGREAHSEGEESEEE